jgi:hypothetical protein
MIPVAITATPAPTPALPGAPAEAPVSADFMALLLLLMGVGSDAPGPEGQDAEAATELPVSEPAHAAFGTPGAVLLVPAPTLPAPVVQITPEVAQAPAPSASPVAAAGVADRAAARPRPEGTLRPAAGPAAGPAAREAGTPASSAPTAVEAPLPAGTSVIPADERLTQLAELAAGRGDLATPAPAGTETAPALDGAQARAAQHAMQELEPVQPDASSARDLPVTDKTAAAPTPAARVLPADTGGAQGHERFEHGERHRDGSRDSGPSALGFSALVDTAGVASLRESHPTTRISAPAGVEPRVVVEQVVQAATVVVRGDETEMHVQLDPPALGTVHVSATTRGSALEVMISADRPETHALLTQALPEIQNTLTERGLGATAVSVVTTPTAGDGRRAPDRRPTEPRDRSTSHPHDRRRTAGASRRVSALDITV